MKRKKLIPHTDEKITFCFEIHDLISEGKIEMALNRLNEYLRPIAKKELFYYNLYQIFSQISFRFYQIKDHRIKGLILNLNTEEDNRVVNDIMNLVRGIMEKAKNEEIVKSIDLPNQKLSENLNSREVLVKIDDEFDDFTIQEEEHFINSIRALLKMNRTITVVQKSRGCVQLNLSMDFRDISKSIKVYNAGFMENLNLINISYPEQFEKFAIDNFSTTFNSVSKKKYLLASNKNISSFKFLKLLINANWVNLDYNPIENLEGIDWLINLKYLSLRNTPIKEAFAICNIIDLEYLNLNFTKIENLYYLKNLKKLKYLYLRGTNIDDIQILSNLNSLLYLDLGCLSSNAELEFNSLSKLDRLICLKLDNNKIKRGYIYKFSNLKKLRYLDLRGTNLKDDDISLVKFYLPKCKVVY